MFALVGCNFGDRREDVSRSGGCPLDTVSVIYSTITCLLVQIKLRNKSHTPWMSLFAFLNIEYYVKSLIAFLSNLNQIKLKMLGHKPNILD